jgi:hypothetical protein
MLAELNTGHNNTNIADESFGSVAHSDILKEANE